MQMDVIIKSTYSNITDDYFTNGQIELRDDGDGVQYLKQWKYSQPIPEGLILGKPNGNI